MVAEARPADPEALARVVRQRLPALVLDLFDARSRQLITSLAHTPVAHEILVAPTSTADRLLARQLLALPGAVMNVILEDDPAGCLERLDAGDERRHRLIRHLVDSCDVLVVLADAEDGDRGGAVEYARARERPVLRIPVATPAEIALDRGHGLNAGAAERLDMFNGFDITPRALDTYVANLRRDIFETAEGRGLPPAGVELALERLAPLYARSALLAKRNQALYRRAGMAVWALFPLATAAVAAGVLVPRFGTAAFAIHLTALLLIAVVVFVADRMRSHDKWLECRLLAERLRAGIFLAACGFEATPLRVPPFMGRESWRNEWAVRAFEEIWRRLPQLGGCNERSCVPVVSFMRRRWLDEQIHFHEDKAAASHRKSRGLERGGRGLFILAVLVAVAHLVIPLPHHGGGDGDAESSALRLLVTGEGLLVFLAIVLPGAGAALGGYRAHREYSRLARRSTDMALALRGVADRLGPIRDPEALGNLMREAEQMMLAEVQDWLMLMRFVPVEPPG